jgi:biotin carboxyl carrier protein
MSSKDQTMAQMKVLSELNAMVWKIEVAAGQRVAAGDTLIVLEAMKMEIPVSAPRDATVAAILVAEKQMVAEGEALAVLDG